MTEAMTGTLTDVATKDHERYRDSSLEVSISESDLTELRRRVKSTSGQSENRSATTRRASSWRRHRNSRAIGSRTMTGARPRPRSKPSLTSPEIDAARHSFHSREVEGKECKCDRLHPRMASSSIERMKVIAPLTNPTAFGGKPRTRSML